MTRPIDMLRDRRRRARAQLARLNRIETDVTHQFRLCDVNDRHYLVVIRSDISLLVDKINELNEAIEREYTRLDHFPLVEMH